MNFLYPANAVVKDENDRFDYSNDATIKMYERATKSLFPKSEFYDCNSEQMHLLLDLLRERATVNGWSENPDGILWVPVDLVDAENMENDHLLDSYGSLTIETVVAWEDHLVEEADYKIQQNHMLFECLWASLSSKAKAAVSLKKEQYHREQISHGMSLLKVVLSESHLDSQATVTALRNRISNLDEHMLELDCNILEFNKYVQQTRESLTARKQISTDLMVNLFKAYKAVKDDAFKQYIEKKESEYEDDGREITVENLMNLAGEKYKSLKLKGMWQAQSATDAKILALETKLRKVTQDKKSKDSKDSKKPAKAGKKQQEKKPDWLLNNKPPKPSELTKARTWKNLNWHWCSPATGGKCEGNWVRHEPSDCRGFKKKAPSATKRVSIQEKGKEKKLKLQKAMTSVVADSASENEE